MHLVYDLLGSKIRDAKRHDILLLHLGDTHGARLLLPDGSFESLRPAGGTGVNTQQKMLEHQSTWRR